MSGVEGHTLVQRECYDKTKDLWLWKCSCGVGKKNLKKEGVPISWHHHLKLIKQSRK